LLFFYLFIVDYAIVSTGVIPRAFSWTPEIFSGIALLVVCTHIARKRIIFIPTRYVIIFSFLIAFFVLGIVVNQVQPGAVFAGIRKYFRYAPFFLLPLVYQFDDKEFGNFVKMLLVFSFLQLPVAIYQKLVLYKINPTGDVIEGTVLGSGHLAVFLICVISMVLAYYLKERISFYKAFIFIVVLFLPVAITEATASIFLLPLAFIIPVIFLKGNKRKIRPRMPVILVGVTIFISFIAIYNLQYSSRWDGSILNAIFQGKATESLYKGATEENTADIPGHAMREIGRVDSMILPIKILSKKGVVVLYGTGLGNASATFSNLLGGEYSWVVEEYGADFTTVGNLLWEIGVIGVLFVITLLIMIFRDAMRLRGNQGTPGAIALGWLGVISVITVSMFYTNLVSHNVVSFLVWFFSGYIISKANINNIMQKNRA
jgi:hypothetical protein